MHALPDSNNIVLFTNISEYEQTTLVYSRRQPLKNRVIWFLTLKICFSDDKLSIRKHINVLPKQTEQNTRYLCENSARLNFHIHFLLQCVFILKLLPYCEKLTLLIFHNPFPPSPENRVVRRVGFTAICTKTDLVQMSHESDPDVVNYPEPDIILPSVPYKLFHSGFTLYYGNGSEHSVYSCQKNFRNDRSVESFFRKPAQSSEPKFALQREINIASPVESGKCVEIFGERH